MKEILLRTDLIWFPEEQEQPADMFLRSVKQNRITVEVTKFGLPYALVGIPSVLFRQPNGTTIEISQNASISGNKLIFDVPDICYANDGPIAFALKLTHDTEKTTLGLVLGTVYP